MASNERRFAIDGWRDADFQIRADGDGMTFHGYAAVFNTDSDGPIPGFGVERIAPTAFDKSLADLQSSGGRNIKMFLNHNSDMVLGSTKAGTLRLAKDDYGLRVEADLPDTQAGRDLSTLLKRGDVDSMSFGFTPLKSQPRDDGVNGTIHTEVRLWEVSPVTSWPAYAATSAFVRQLAEATGLDPDEITDLLTTAERAAEDGVTFSDEQYRRWLAIGNRLRGDRPEIVPDELVALVSRTTSRKAELAELERLVGQAK